MSDSTAKRLPSLMRPIAIPATCAFIGAPASINARLAPHTEADRDGTHRARITPVDARLARQDLAAHDRRFELVQEIVHLVRVSRRRIRGNALRLDPCGNLAQVLTAKLLLTHAIGFAQSA